MKKKQTPLLLAYYAYHGAVYRMRRADARMNEIFGFTSHGDPLIEETALEHRNAEEALSEAKSRLRALLNG